MTSLEEQLSALAREARLTPKEKAKGRAMLEAAMTLAKDSPEFSLSPAERVRGKELLMTRMERASFNIFGSWKWIATPAFTLVLLAAGGGVAFASNAAIPGDTLYPVKIHVVEPMLGALKSTPEEQAAWSIELLHRRVRESELLQERRTDDVEHPVLEESLHHVRESIDRVRRSTRNLPEDGRREDLRKEATEAVEESMKTLRKLQKRDERKDEDVREDEDERKKFHGRSEQNEDERSSSSSSQEREEHDGRGRRREKKQITLPNVLPEVMLSGSSSSSAHEAEDDKEIRENSSSSSKGNRDDRRHGGRDHNDEDRGEKRDLPLRAPSLPVSLPKL